LASNSVSVTYPDKSGSTVPSTNISISPFPKMFCPLIVLIFSPDTKISCFLSKDSVIFSPVLWSITASEIVTGYAVYPLYCSLTFLAIN
jgi:hypothetical protein